MVNLPTKRLKDILFSLLKSLKPITISDLANKLNVSNRTIRSDLNKLAEWGLNRNLNLIKKTGVGVWLEIDDLRRRQFLQSLGRVNNYTEQLSPYQREQYILRLLLQFDSKYTAQSLAEELYVSRATVYKDLKEVEKWLVKYNLTLERERNYILNIKGQESDWRKAVADLLARLKNNQKLNDILAESDDFSPDSRFDNQTYHQINSLLGDIRLEKIESILSELEKSLDFVFTDEAFIGLVIHIAISFERLKKGKDIKMNQEQLESLKNKTEFKVAELIAQKLQTELGIIIPTAEIGYISLHILGSKLKQDINSVRVDDVLKNSDDQVIMIARDIIITAEEVLSIDLSKDKQLLLGLVLHLRSTINRLKYGMSLRNPLLSQIKSNYPAIYGAAWATSVIFEEHLGVKIEEEEIGYLAIHLGAALERINNKIKAIVVCGSGIGTSQLAATKLASRLLNLEIVDLLAVHELKQENLQGIDIIITTVPLQEFNDNIVQVSPLITDNDINLIKTKVNNLLTVKKQNILNIKYDKIDELFDNDLIFINLNINSKVEIIKFLSNKLLIKDRVDEFFVESVLEREEFTSTRMAMGVAIPHGTEERHILKSAIAVATLARPVEWGDGFVKIIFLLALKKEEGRKFFKHFHPILENEIILNKLKNTSEKRLIIESILKFNQR